MPPRLVQQHKRDQLKPPEVTQLTRVPGNAPRAIGGQWLIGYAGPVAVTLDFTGIPEAERTELMHTFLDAIRNAANLDERPAS